jgi:hypothetical protein
VNILINFKKIYRIKYNEKRRYEMTKRKTFLIVSLFLGISMIAGLTLSYLTTTSGTKTNTFTLGSNIAIKLAEPTWDNLNYDNEPAGVIEPHGQDLAQNFIPGRVIPKNPSVKNASLLNNVWVAIKIDYTVGAKGDAIPDTYAELSKFATIDWNLGIEWEAKTLDYIVFYYKENAPVAPFDPTPLAPNDVTDVLFSNVTISTLASQEALHPFELNIKSYAVQATGLSYEDAKIELDALIALNP